MKSQIWLTLCVLIFLTCKPANALAPGRPIPPPIVISGYGNVVYENIQHPNGEIFDQVLLTGKYVVVQATKPTDYFDSSIVRVLYIDENGDIVIVEMGGEGTLRIELDPDTYSGPAYPVKYRNSARYVKGRATIIVDNATVNTFIRIFTINSYLLGGSHVYLEDVIYDGMADIASLHVYGSGFNELILENVRFSDDDGPTGVLAYDVNVLRKVIIHDIDARGSAVPHLVIGRDSALTEDNGAIVIAGGDLVQSNGSNIKVQVGSRLAGDSSSIVSQASSTVISTEPGGMLVLPAKVITAVFEEDYEKPFVNELYYVVNNSQASLDGKSYEYTFDDSPELRFFIGFNGDIGGDVTISERFSFYGITIYATRTGSFGFGLNPVNLKKGYIDIVGDFMTVSAGLINISGNIEEVAEKYGFTLPLDASIEITLPPDSSSFGTFTTETTLTDGQIVSGSGTFRRL